MCNQIVAVFQFPGITHISRTSVNTFIQKIYAFVRPVATALSGSSASSKESEDCILEDVTYEVFVGYCRVPNSDAHPHRPYLYFIGEPFARCNFCKKFLEHIPNSDN